MCCMRKKQRARDSNDKRLTPPSPASGPANRSAAQKSSCQPSKVPGNSEHANTSRSSGNNALGTQTAKPKSFWDRIRGGNCEGNKRDKQATGGTTPGGKKDAACSSRADHDTGRIDSQYAKSLATTQNTMQSPTPGTSPADKPIAPPSGSPANQQSLQSIKVEVEGVDEKPDAKHQRTGRSTMSLVGTQRGEISEEAEQSNASAYHTFNQGTIALCESKSHPSPKPNDSPPAPARNHENDGDGKAVTPARSPVVVCKSREWEQELDPSRTANKNRTKPADDDTLADIDDPEMPDLDLPSLRKGQADEDDSE
ncbi:hypothetical protein AAVH_01587 [Aphelenchoides avenae]|nr:hypothetical protein AAVH_01587 [Aphelenchus avenae]